MYPVIGLEIHTQLKTASKMFCSCVNEPEVVEPNSHICPLCLGHPGTLPVINKDAVIKVLETGRALDCELRDISRFDRKNYFYPDLPKGYQISQDRRPLCYNGHLKVGEKRIRINRIHLEEDTGRLIHDEKKGYSLVDFNRSGVPLMELVTEADIRSGEEARGFAEELRLILRHLEISEGNMEKGQMRVEVNISLSHMEGRKGTRVEIKNLNSFRTVQKAVEYETKRQKSILEKGERIIQETRGWDEGKQATFSQRDKEDVHDYRYFPEPDLPPLILNEPPFNKDKLHLRAELPQKKRERFIQEYGITDKKEMEVFIGDKDLSNYFEKVVSEISGLGNGKDIKGAVHHAKSYLLSDLLGILGGESINECRITPENFAEFVMLIHEKKISSKIAKGLLKEMSKKGEEPSHIVKEHNLSQMDDRKEIEKIVEEVLKENETAVKDYKEGKETALQFLVGQVMAKTKGKAEPGKVNETLKKKLS